jgi:hypothetical protein
VLHLPAPTSYALPDDVPVYPRAALREGLPERISSAWAWTLGHSHTRTYHLPAEDTVQDITAWYAQAMTEGGWTAIAFPPTMTPPSGLRTISWRKGSERGRLAQITLTEEAGGEGYQLLLSASHDPS